MDSGSLFPDEEHPILLSRNVLLSPDEFLEVEVSVGESEDAPPPETCN
jgi:hypothetical protein